MRSIARPLFSFLSGQCPISPRHLLLLMPQRDRPPSSVPLLRQRRHVVREYRRIYIYKGRKEGRKERRRREKRERERKWAAIERAGGQETSCLTEEKSRAMRLSMNN